MKNIFLPIVLVILIFTDSGLSFWSKCTKRASERNAKATVLEVRITPPPEDDVCKFPKGTNASIEIDFTSPIGFGTISKNVKNSMMWETSMIDLPFSGLHSLPCESKFLKCPILSSVNTHYKAVLHIGENLPTGIFPVKYVLKEKSKIFVCFKFTVQVVD